MISDFDEEFDCDNCDLDYKLDVSDDYIDNNDLAGEASAIARTIANNRSDDRTAVRDHGNTLPKSDWEVVGA